jgi:hypothetical protein
MSGRAGGLFGLIQFCPGSSRRANARRWRAQFSLHGEGGFSKGLATTMGQGRETISGVAFRSTHCVGLLFGFKPKRDPDPEQPLLGPGQCRGRHHQQRRLRQSRQGLCRDQKICHDQGPHPENRSTERREHLLAARSQPEQSYSGCVVGMEPSSPRARPDGRNRSLGVGGFLALGSSPL